VLAAWLASRQLQDLHARDLAAALAATGWTRLAASACLGALSFACLAHYEWIAVRWAVPGRIPRAVAWRTGLVAHALANTLGFHAVTAGAVRWRAYSRCGVSLAEVARIVALVAACVGMGVLALGLAALLAWQVSEDARGRMLAAGLVVLACSGLLLRMRALRRTPGARIVPAGLHPLALGAVGLVEMGAAVGALYVLLPAGAVAPAPFALAFLGAMLAGLASHVPGGLGVFEAAMIGSLPSVPAADVLAALLAYRAIYGLAPCGIAVVALLLQGHRSRRTQSIPGG